MRHELEICSIYRTRKCRGQMGQFALSEVGRCFLGAAHHPTWGVATPVNETVVVVQMLRP